MTVNGIRLTPRLVRRSAEGSHVAATTYIGNVPGERFWEPSQRAQHGRVVLVAEIGDEPRYALTTLGRMVLGSLRGVRLA